MRLILVGGGLANSLIAHRLAAARPDVDSTILEAGDELGGNHTWYVVAINVLGPVFAVLGATRDKPQPV